MNLIKKFKQRQLIEIYTNAGNVLPTRGICFRVVFKWTACAMKGGEFKYDQLNVFKTAGKHLQYRTGSMAKENDLGFDFGNPASLRTYIDDDMQEAANYINNWGVLFKDKNKTEYNGVRVSERLNDNIFMNFLGRSDVSDVTFVYGFYGSVSPSGVTLPAGHATGFCRGQFFDPNFGVFEFDSDDPAVIGAEIDAHVKQYYPWGTKQYAMFMLESV